MVAALQFKHSAIGESFGFKDCIGVVRRFVLVLTFQPTVHSVHESFAECSMKNFVFILLSAGDFINSIKLHESENFFRID